MMKHIVEGGIHALRPGEQLECPGDSAGPSVIDIGAERGAILFIGDAPDDFPIERLFRRLSEQPAERSFIPVRLQRVGGRKGQQRLSQFRCVRVAEDGRSRIRGLQAERFDPGKTRDPVRQLSEGL